MVHYSIHIGGFYFLTSPVDRCKPVCQLCAQWELTKFQIRCNVRSAHVFPPAIQVFPVCCAFSRSSQGAPSGSTLWIEKRPWSYVYLLQNRRTCWMMILCQKEGKWLSGSGSIFEALSVILENSPSITLLDLPRKQWNTLMVSFLIRLPQELFEAWIPPLDKETHSNILQLDENPLINPVSWSHISRWTGNYSWRTVPSFMAGRYHPQTSGAEFLAMYLKATLSGQFSSTVRPLAWQLDSLSRLQHGIAVHIHANSRVRSRDSNIVISHSTMSSQMWYLGKA